MNFYEALLKYSKKEYELPFGDDGRDLFPGDDVESSKKFYQDITLDINKELGTFCDADRAYSVLIWDSKEGEMKLIFAVDTDKSSVDECKKYIEGYFYDNFKVSDIKFSNVMEITTSRFCQLGEKGDDNDYIRRFHAEENELGINYHNNSYFKLKELVLPEELITKEETIEQAKSIMAERNRAYFF